QMPPANPNQGFFGAKFSDIDDETAEKLGLDSQDGVVIMEVMPDSPAEKAGIKNGDVVKKLDDKEIGAKEDFVAVMRASKPDQQLKVSVIREKQPQDITVTLAKRPASMDALDKQMQKERMEKEKEMEKDNDKGPATKPN
ncbi:MAG: PDZ domain-containing protein, partial [Anaerolineae bacterium]|nr:PDZ domain-containing protein [Phycisphaerae bacterium]